MSSSQIVSGINFRVIPHTNLRAAPLFAIAPPTRYYRPEPATRNPGTTLTTELRDTLQLALGDAFAIDREIGGGGMSRVFVADEKALGRKVVVKVFPIDSSGGLSIERFKREIQLAAQLQHPHIVPVLSAGEAGGIPYYMMPFVRGDSLRQLLTRSGERTVSESVRILRDVASALAHAHSEGIVHRDIKPENIMLSGGVAVVTDFGVAKALDEATAREAQHGSATGAGNITSLGVALGTPAYMSPEQASADPGVDHRADIYSLGCVGYELLTGSPPFAGRTPQHILAAHVNEQPEPLLKRRASVPRPLADLITRCLEKRAADRPQSAEQIVQALDAITTPSGGMTPAGARRNSPLRILVVAAVLIVAATAIAAAMLRGRLPSTYSVGDDSPIVASPLLELDAAISPDGKFVAYAAGTLGDMKIFVRQVGGGRTIPLSTGAEGDSRWPRWSPDGTQIAFEGPEAIFVVPALGGSVRRFVDAGSFPAWSPDGSEIAYFAYDGAMTSMREFSGSGNVPGAIMIRSVQSATARKLIDAVDGGALAWSPNGRLIAFTVGNSAFLTGNNVNTAPSQIYVVAISGSAAKPVSDRTHLNTSPAWAPDSRSLMFVSNLQGSRDVYQIAVNSDGSARGEPVRITSGTNAHSITLSADGSLMAYSTFLMRANIWTAPLDSRSATPFSAARQITHDNQSVEAMSVSYDGKWLFYDSNRSGNSDIYKLQLDAAGGASEPVRLTDSPADDFAPRMSKDGREVVFYSLRHGTRDLFVMQADGTNQERITDFTGQEYHPDWSPDGKRIAFTYAAQDSGFTVQTIARGPDGKWSAPQSVSTDFTGRTTFSTARWSLDGVHMAIDRRDADSLWLVTNATGEKRILSSGQVFGGDASVSQLDWHRSENAVIVHVTSRAQEDSFWSVRVADGARRLLLRLDEPGKKTRRNEFGVDDKNLYFTIASDEADARIMTLRKQQ